MDLTGWPNPSGNWGRRRCPLGQPLLLPHQLVAVEFAGLLAVLMPHITELGLQGQEHGVVVVQWGGSDCCKP